MSMYTTPSGRRRGNTWKGIGDGMLMDCREDGDLQLNVCLNQPSEEEIGLFKTGKIEISISEHETIALMIVRFGDAPYNMCPFTPMLDENADKFMGANHAEGTQLHMELFDTETGKEIAARTIMLGQEFTEEVLRWAEESTGCPKRITYAKCGEMVSKVLKKNTVEGLRATAAAVSVSD